MSVFDVPARRAASGQGSIGFVAAVAAALALFASLAARTLDPLEQPTTSLALLGGAALILFLWLAVARFEWAVGLAFLLFGIVRFEPAPPDLALLVVISIALVTNRFELRRLPPAIFFLLGSFVFLNVVSAVEALEPLRAAGFFGITLYLIVLAVWVTAFVRSRRAARLVVGCYVWGAVLASAATLAALVLGGPGGDLLVYGGLRGQGLFKDPNVWGPFLVPAVVFLIEDFFGARLVVRRRWVAGLLVTLLVAASVTSYSRASWANLGVALLAMLAVFLLRRGSGGRALALVAALVAVVGAVTAVMVVSGSIDFLRERASLQRYDTERFSTQASGADVAAAHPLGVGPGQFELFAETSAHSLYVRGLAEHGVVGGAILLALVMATFGFALANAVRGRSTYGISSAALLGAWAGIAVNSAFVDTLHWRHLWLVAGLVWAGAMRRDGDPDRAAASPSR